MEKIAFERPFIKKLSAGMPSKFGMKTEIKPVTHIDDVAVEELIQKYGSPLFVISEKTMRETYQEAYRAFSTRYPKVQFAWSYKTNYLDAVCRVFHQEGSWAEVVSGFEFDKALANGIPGNKILFNGPDKPEEYLKKAIEQKAYIHIDHFDELYTLKQLAATLKTRPRVAIRVNMDVGIYPKWDRFGFNYENGEAWDALNRIMISESFELEGLHAHIGTYMMTTEAYGIAAAKLADLATGLERKYGHVIKYIDMGGGFASKNTLKGAYLPGTDTAPSFDEYAEAITSALINSGIKPENLPMLILETGRALIDDAGYLLGTVIANKRLSSGYRSTIVDVGVNLLFTSFWYEHQISPARPTTQHTEETAVFGPLCMNIDVIRESMVFPLLKTGDRFVISRIGAYNMTQWMQFITLRPNVVMIDPESKVHLIREKESLETIRQQERIPGHLQAKKQ
ncbi:MAG TPA: diaminopimelate decarboxylase [Bacteroidetes bacterium]|nr:diaminopimelate decarboxylase [Bacteroidota bacterium]